MCGFAHARCGRSVRAPKWALHNTHRVTASGRSHLAGALAHTNSSAESTAHLLLKSWATAFPPPPKRSVRKKSNAHIVKTQELCVRSSRSCPGNSSRYYHSTSNSHCHHKPNQLLHGTVQGDSGGNLSWRSCGSHVRRQQIQQSLELPRRREQRARHRWDIADPSITPSLYTITV